MIPDVALSAGTWALNCKDETLNAGYYSINPETQNRPDGESHGIMEVINGNIGLSGKSNWKLFRFYSTYQLGKVYSMFWNNGSWTNWI